MSTYDGIPPKLGDLIASIAEEINSRSFAALPVTVVGIDPLTQCVDLQSNAQRLDNDGLPEALPILPCCPVQFFTAGLFTIGAAPILGDTGLVIFSSLSMASWFVSGSPAALPESDRRGSLSDGVFIPGLHSLLTAPAPFPGLFMGTKDRLSGVTVTPGAVSVEAALIQLGATAVEPLTRAPGLAVMLAQIKVDLEVLSTAVLAASLTAAGIPKPLITLTVTNQATTKIIGE